MDSVTNVEYGELIAYIQQHELCMKHKIDPDFIQEIVHVLNVVDMFPLNISQSMKWMGINQKDDVMDILTSKYEQDLDYIKIHGATMISTDCFKLLCIDMDTKLGEQTYTNFQIIGKIAREYAPDKYNMIQDDLDYANAKLSLMTHALFDVEADDIYVIKMKSRDIYKIATEKCNTDEIVYQCGCPNGHLMVEIIKVVMIGYEDANNKEYYNVPLDILTRTIEEQIETLDHMRTNVECTMDAHYGCAKNN